MWLGKCLAAKERRDRKETMLGKRFTSMQNATTVGVGSRLQLPQSEIFVLFAFSCGYQISPLRRSPFCLQRFGFTGRNACVTGGGTKKNPLLLGADIFAGSRT